MSVIDRLKRLLDRLEPILDRLPDDELVRRLTVMPAETLTVRLGPIPKSQRLGRKRSRRSATR
jgi:hypothetical protein